MSTYLVILIGIADAISEKWIEFAPMFLLGAQQPMQLPQPGVSFVEGNGFLNSGNEENSRESVLNLANRCTLSNQPFVIPSATNITIPETSLGFEESGQAHYEPLNLSSSKVILLGIDN
jgi:hypothetical protein